tara:strand:- start:207 stop:494 length:288 start_codon:yes stop_codon:yes gene_type:complete
LFHSAILQGCKEYIVLPQVPESVSYEELLNILQDRIAEGNIPEDNEYFAELIYGLVRRVDLCQKLEEKRTTRQGETSVVIDFVPYLDSKKNKVNQ